MKVLGAALAGAAMLASALPAAAHFDIAPYLVDGQLLTGGMYHEEEGLAPKEPTITTYLYDFGEEDGNPYNPSDPGVNQAVGVGNLPAGAALRYNILTSLMYWDGTGVATFITPPTASYVELFVSGTTRTLDGNSGPQAGSSIQSIGNDGAAPVHRHFTTSLFHHEGASNNPEETTFVKPEDGIYAFQLELTLNDSGTMYTSNPFWIVFNNGLTEELHAAAGAALAVPEPASLAVLACGAAALLMRRRKN